MSQKYYTPKEAQTLLRISRTTFYDWLKKGIIPPGLRLGPRSRRWTETELLSNGRIEE